MRKTELIKAIIEKTEGFTQKNIETILTVLAETVTDALTNGDTVPVPGIGKFSVKDVAARKGIIHLGDKKGEEYTTPAHRKPVFKPSTQLKETVR